jgi:signal transduction histidine kinase
VKPYNDRIKFAVEDTGSGIKKENISSLFKLFGKLEQDDPTVNAGGVGLGLTVSQTLVRLINKNQGEIKVKSTPGVGSKFSFSIYEVISR